MKNITIKLDDDVAKWAKVWAAEHDTSVSQILGDLLKRLKEQKNCYHQAKQQFLSFSPQQLNNNNKYPSRDELYER